MLGANELLEGICSAVQYPGWCVGGSIASSIRLNAGTRSHL